jgi:hypothetical protein
MRVREGLVQVEESHRVVPCLGRGDMKWRCSVLLPVLVLDPVLEDLQGVARVSRDLDRVEVGLLHHPCCPLANESERDTGEEVVEEKPMMAQLKVRLAIIRAAS